MLLLHRYFYYTRCLVTRDYLIQKVERNICRFENKPVTSSDDVGQIIALGEDCIASAYGSVKCMNRINELGYLNRVAWLDGLYIFHAVLVVCADFLVRPTD